MKTYLTALFALVLTSALFTASTSLAGGGGFAGEKFVGMKCFSAGATGSGANLTDAAPLATNKVVMAAPAKSVIEGVDVVVTTVITGSSPQVNVGDAGDADGFVADANVTEGTAGAYVGAGAYLNGAHKYYASATNISYAAGGTLSAGAMCVIVHGYKLPQ